MSSQSSLQIQSVARLTKLSVDTIRAWEKRYAAVCPERGTAGRRLFSADDVARLVLLKEAVDSGESISQVASLSTSELRNFVGAEQRAGDVDDATIERLFSGVRSMDAAQLAADLSFAALSRSAVEFADDIIAPLMVEIGASARSLDESVARQLVLCQCVQSIASVLFAKYPHPLEAPRMVFVTMPGDRHAVAPLLAALAACEAGYSAIYGGTEVSAEHVEALARFSRACAVGIYVGVQSADALRMVHDVVKRLPALSVFVGSPGLNLNGFRATHTLRDFAAVLAATPSRS